MMPNARSLVLAVAASLSLLCASCEAPWSPEAKQTAIDTVDRLEAEGTLSGPQAEAAREAVERAARGFGWQDLLGELGYVAGAALLAFLGVERRRGPRKPMTREQSEALREVAERELQIRRGG